MDAPTWSPPGLAFVDTRPATGGIVGGINMLNVVDTVDDPRLPGGKALLTQEFQFAGKYRVFNETLELVLERDTGSSMLFPEVVRLPGEPPAFLVPEWDLQHPALFDLVGDKIREYPSEPLVPGTQPVHLGWWMPAIGDFTGDGHAELVFAANDEWQVFSQQGEIIARHVVTDPYDRGFRAWASPEDDRGYIYVTSGPHSSAVDEFKARLHKVALAETLPALRPGAAPELPFSDMLGSLQYTLEREWLVEFTSLPSDEALSFYDLTGDGSRELIFQHADDIWPVRSALSVLRADGEVLYTSPEAVVGVTAVGDVNGDGIDEVVLMKVEMDPGPRYWKPSTVISGLQWDGSAFKEIYTFQADGEFGGRWMTLCDLNGDGRDEIILGIGEPDSVQDSIGRYVGDGKLKVLDGSGTTLWEYRFLAGQQSVRPIVLDFTGDGRYEIIAGNNAGQIFVFSSALAPSFRDYEMPLAALRQNGTLDDELHAELLARAREITQGVGDTLEDGAAEESPSPSWILATVVAAVLLAATRRPRQRALATRSRAGS